jgi:hypothetical protein
MSRHYTKVHEVFRIKREYKKRMKQMSTSESAEEYNALYQKMVQDNIVDKDKYEQYQADEKA